MSYEEAAQMTGCMVGTMKSRVSRARLQLANLLDRGTSSRRAQSSTPGNALVA